MQVLYCRLNYAKYKMEMVKVGLIKSEGVARAGFL